MGTVPKTLVYVITMTVVVRVKAMLATEPVLTLSLKVIVRHQDLTRIINFTENKAISSKTLHTCRHSSIYVFVKQYHLRYHTA